MESCCPQGEGTESRKGEQVAAQGRLEGCSSTSLSSCRDAADLVVQGKGKFEELMVCSHEIAASTAQLVAASKVRARYAVPLSMLWGS